NQDYPLDLVVQDQRIRRGKNAALYNVVFVGQNAHKGVQDFDGVTFKRYHQIEDLLNGKQVDQAEEAQAQSDDPNAALDLHIEAFEEAEQIVLRTQYNANRFTAATVDLFLSQYEYVLEQFVQDPELRLSQVQLQKFDVMDELF
ncbi:MAG: condensation domain-containing protein, partial [Tumebacillaceae bacterium]